MVDPADEWTPLLPAADVDGSSASAAKVTFVCPDSVSSAALDRVRTMPRPRTSDSQTSSSSTAGRTFPRKRPQLPRREHTPGMLGHGSRMLPSPSGPHPRRVPGPSVRLVGCPSAQRLTVAGLLNCPHAIVRRNGPPLVPPNQVIVSGRHGGISQDFASQPTETCRRIFFREVRKFLPCHVIARKR